MDINKEIEKIIEYQNSTLPQSSRKTREALEEIINQVKNDEETMLQHWLKEMLRLPEILAV